MNSNDNSGKMLAVADQAIKSAGNILAAAGFDRDEIATFFRQAADQLSGGSAQAPVSSAGAPAATQITDAERIRAALHDIASVRALDQLAAQAEAPGTSEDSVEPLKHAYELAMKMIPHIGEAQNWLRRSGEESGLVIAATRGTATEGTVEAGAKTLFFEDFQSAYQSSFEHIAGLADALVTRGDEEAFFQLLVALVDEDVSVSRELKDAMETGVRRFGLRNAFQQFVLERSDEPGEAEVVEEFLRSQDCSDMADHVTGWLQDLEQQGLIERPLEHASRRIRVTGSAG